MDLKEIVSISGMSGLYRMEGQRSNGIIVQGLNDDKKKFISSRQHMFTPLENITVYTEDEGVELKDVFQEMKRKENEVPVPDAGADSGELQVYMGEIVPDYDREKVYVSDIKKIIKWYILLNENDLIDLEEDKSEEKETKEEEESTNED